MAGPFGLRRVTYADYTASGRSLAFIENFMTSFTGEEHPANGDELARLKHGAFGCAVDERPHIADPVKGQGERFGPKRARLVDQLQGQRDLIKATLGSEEELAEALSWEDIQELLQV